MQPGGLLIPIIPGQLLPLFILPATLAFVYKLDGTQLHVKYLPYLFPKRGEAYKRVFSQQISCIAGRSPHSAVHITMQLTGLRCSRFRDLSSSRTAGNCRQRLQTASALPKTASESRERLLDNYWEVIEPVSISRGRHLTVRSAQSRRSAAFRRCCAASSAGRSRQLSCHARAHTRRPAASSTRTAGSSSSTSRGSWWRRAPAKRRRWGWPARARARRCPGCPRRGTCTAPAPRWGGPQGLVGVWVGFCGGPGMHHGSCS
jgi:hypothetical protein